jgi:UDP-N-acetylmuramyl pentapeptide phosphotransferase/UDP-N-acetylglucosamine-1-phosphate transferase
LGSRRSNRYVVRTGGGQQFYDQVGSRIYAFLFGVLAMFCTGFADDIFHLNYKIRFVVQTAVGLVMVFWGG